MSTVPAPATPTARPRYRAVITAEAFANGMAITALVALAVVLARWQVDAWHGPVLNASTLLGAATVVAAYAGFVRLLGNGKRRSAASTSGATASPQDTHAAEWLVVYASQFGDAESLAARTARSLQDAGHAVQLVDLATLDLPLLHRARNALFVASTTGEGDAPDSAVNFVRDCMRSTGTRLEGLRYGILALGDSDYEKFCAFGHQIDTWLRSAGAEPLFDLVKVDDGDAGALRHWQYLLGQWGGAVGQMDWKPPAYRAWTLDTRHHLNPGSPGYPVFDVHLTPENVADLQWQAGDVAEIGPRNGPEAVRAWLDAAGLRGEALVTRDDRTGGRSLALSELVAASRLPGPGTVIGQDAQAVADELQPLPHRAYSIASVPAEGRVRLLVRQVRNDDGALGLGSGWLTEHAEPSETVDMRIRRNAAFHAPTDQRPMILIGNGTGVAGLRALLRERISAGRHRNWLLFGERSGAHDFHYSEDIHAWERSGYIERIDMAFSRDQAMTRYVQHLVRENAEGLRDWFEQGAAVYVCGSSRGMAPGVDAALAEIVGRESLDVMAADGRYRRDVY